MSLDQLARDAKQRGMVLLYVPPLKHQPGPGRIIQIPPPLKVRASTPR
jgi:hypothetical protein